LQGFGLSTHKLYRFEQGTKGILGFVPRELDDFHGGEGKEQEGEAMDWREEKGREMQPCLLASMRELQKGERVLLLAGLIEKKKN
jgi:hypothetical protein